MEYADASEEACPLSRSVLASANHTAGGLVLDSPFLSYAMSAAARNASAARQGVRNAHELRDDGDTAADGEAPNQE